MKNYKVYFSLIILICGLYSCSEGITDDSDKNISDTLSVNTDTTNIETPSTSDSLKIINDIKSKFDSRFNPEEMFGKWILVSLKSPRDNTELVEKSNLGFSFIRYFDFQIDTKVKPYCPIYRIIDNGSGIKTTHQNPAWTYNKNLKVLTLWLESNDLTSFPWGASTTADELKNFQLIGDTIFYHNEYNFKYIKLIDY